jgi:4-amino-4-deoxy-L-arabinose transferase-like glycosyltransferase
LETLKTAKKQAPAPKNHALPSARVDLTVEVPDGAQVEIHIHAKKLDGMPLDERTVVVGDAGGGEEGRVWSGETPAARSILPRVRANVRDMWLRLAKVQWTSEGALLWAVVLVYLLTRFIGLDRFPIYFFTDEAVQTVLAQDLVRDQFMSYSGETFPTFFVNGNQYNLGTSVYLQLIPWLITFTKSIWITRGVSVLVTLLSVLAVSLIIRNIFKISNGWLAGLVLSITPAWFLHSRTAFETVLAATFYAAFLWFYLRYRHEHARYLYAAIVFGALTFYSYSPAQLVMAVTAALLLLSDARYHWQQRRYVFRGLGLAVVLGLPYLRFYLLHPDENIKHLQIISSYWVQDLSIWEKLGRYFKEYLRGLDPYYWFIPNQTDLVRHLMKNYGNLLRWLMPFTAGGLALAVWNIRKSEYRVILIALLAAPAGAALAGLGITRALFMVIPAALLTAIGISAALKWLERVQIPGKVLTVGTFVIFSAVNFWMLRDALVNGPTWFRDYGLGGMQCCAEQIFPEIKATLAEDPSTKVVLTPGWANGTDVVARFYFDDPLPFELASIDAYTREKREITDKTLFVLTWDEFEEAGASGKFDSIVVEKTLMYPDGSPGFYFLRMQYVDNIDEIIASERASRKALVAEEARVNAQIVQVLHSNLDMGTAQEVFDGDPETLIRSTEANPLQVQVTFPVIQTINGVSVKVGGVASEVVVTIKSNLDSEPISYILTAPQSPDPKWMDFDFDLPQEVIWVEVAVRSVYDDEPAHVHVWEISFRQEPRP